MTMRALNSSVNAIAIKMTALTRAHTIAEMMLLILQKWVTAT